MQLIDVKAKYIIVSAWAKRPLSFHWGTAHQI